MEKKKKKSSNPIGLWRTLFFGDIKCNHCLGYKKPPHNVCCWLCLGLDECYFRWLKNDHHCPVNKGDRWCSRVKKKYREGLPRGIWNGRKL